MASKKPRVRKPFFSKSIECDHNDSKQYIHELNDSPNSYYGCQTSNGLKSLFKYKSQSYHKTLTCTEDNNVLKSILNKGTASHIRYAFRQFKCLGKLGVSSMW